MLLAVILDFVIKISLLICFTEIQTALMLRDNYVWIIKLSRLSITTARMATTLS